MVMATPNRISLPRLLPGLGVLARYQRSWLRGDVIAGVTGMSGCWSTIGTPIAQGNDVLTVLPGILLMMTSFTRIIIVLAILRQALGLQQTPPNQVLVGLSMFLTFFIMAPTINQMNTTAIQPYAEGKITSTKMIEGAGAALHVFMIKQTRNKDVKMFADMCSDQRLRLFNRHAVNLRLTIDV